MWIIALLLAILRAHAACPGPILVHVQSGEVRVEGVHGPLRPILVLKPEDVLLVSADATLRLQEGENTVTLTTAGRYECADLHALLQSTPVRPETALVQREVSNRRVGGARGAEGVVIDHPPPGPVSTLNAVRWRCAEQPCPPMTVVVVDFDTKDVIWLGEGQESVRIDEITLKPLHRYSIVVQPQDATSPVQPASSLIEIPGREP